MEINRKHIKSAQVIAEQDDGMCTDVLCRECPFSSHNDPLGECCCYNDFYTGSSEGRTLRAQKYLNDCQRELENRFNNILDYCSDSACRDCIMSNECAALDDILKTTYAFNAVWRNKRNLIVNTIMKGD